jgi:hypothetical protein
MEIELVLLGRKDQNQQGGEDDKKQKTFRSSSPLNWVNPASFELIAYTTMERELPRGNSNIEKSSRVLRAMEPRNFPSCFAVAVGENRRDRENSELKA